MRLHGSARSEPLQVIENHAIARSDTAANDAAAAELWAEFDGAIFGLVAVADDEHKAFALIVADRAFRTRSASSSVPSPMRTDTNMPGTRLPSLLSKRARARIVPEPVSILLSKLSI